MKKSQVRVTSGSAGGLWIRVPKNFKSRPTQDKVKQAVFSKLGALVAGARALDLFAGTGSLGIEALSRGAASCAFVDDDPACARAIRENLKHCGLEAKSVVFNQKVEAFFKNSEGKDFSLVFLDPPYSLEPTDLAKTSLAENLARKFPPATLVVWEHRARDVWSGHAAFKNQKRAVYGETAVLFLEIAG